MKYNGTVHTRKKNKNSYGTIRDACAVTASGVPLYMTQHRQCESALNVWLGDRGTTHF